MKSIKTGRCASTWFLTGQTTSTLTVPMTHNSELKSKVQEALKDLRGPDGGHCQVLEDAGTPVSLLAPGAKPTGCPHQKKCLIGDSDCMTSGVTYHCVCNECPQNDSTVDPPSLYIGTTGSNIHYRSLLHKRDIKKPSSALHRHNEKYHADTLDDTSRFSFKKVSAHSNVIGRLIHEAHSIAHSDVPLMNGKNEYGQGKWIALESTKFNT